jgi:Ca2+-binding RTX toxin-like protein
MFRTDEGEAKGRPFFKIGDALRNSLNALAWWRRGVRPVGCRDRTHGRRWRRRRLLIGRAGNDTLLGGAGNDVLNGAPEQDVLDGGPGDNILVQ